MTEKTKYLLNIGNNISENAHQFLINDKQSYDKSEIRRLSTYIINKYLSKNYVVSKLKKLKSIDFNWVHPKQGEKKGIIRLDDIYNHILETGSFNHEVFNLPPLENIAFDSSIDLGLPQPLLSTDGKRETAKIRLPLQFGSIFPISPTLDREGFATNNLQTYVLQNVVNLHKMLVDRSYLACSIRNEWFINFRMLLNECVSSIDMHLHQIYFLAEYRSNEFGWKFNKAELGARHGQRVMDKFKWVGKITGNPLDDSRDEVKGFRVIKDLRNHLSHFDPPCFCCTLEEVKNWFNLIPDIGRLLWKIRQKLGIQLNVPIVELIMLPRVCFEPMNPSADRPHSSQGIGYQTSNWK